MFKRYRRWTPNDIEQAKSLLAQGYDIKVVAVMMHISYNRLYEKIIRKREVNE